MQKADKFQDAYVRRSGITHYRYKSIAQCVLQCASGREGTGGEVLHVYGATGEEIFSYPGEGAGQETPRPRSLSDISLEPGSGRSYTLKPPTSTNQGCHVGVIIPLAQPV